MNFILAFVFMVISVALSYFAPNTTVFDVIFRTCSYACVINIGLGIFNLIPLPPLDGEKIFRNISI